jgi:PTH1 family peptidyl-tRNA hydrolase
MLHLPLLHLLHNLNAMHKKVIIGLGNPGLQFNGTRHNIGFMVLDALAKQEGASFSTAPLLQSATYTTPTHTITLIKPQTFMNDSGKVIPGLKKKGIAPDDILVVHDELELPFGAVKLRLGGSARGHNGLRSLIEQMGPEFWRLRIGIDRPADKGQVSDYVLSRFTQKPAEIENVIQEAIIAIHAWVNGTNPTSTHSVK